MASATLAYDAADLPAFPGWKVRSHDEHMKRGSDLWGLHSAISAYEREKQASDRVRAFSAPAGQFVDLEIQRGVDGQVNWRETLICPITGLNNRARAAFHLFTSEHRHNKNAHIFLTEQTSEFCRQLSRRFPKVVGSEYLPHLAPGSVKNGIRNEDLTRLTFRSKQFDAILTFDVLEHVPDYVAALRECARVLKPGGRAYITAPFTYTADTTVRARVQPDGTIEHLMEPEYHGDPIGSGGILCYYHFGYDLLDKMRLAGFSDAYVLLYGSLELGYLGDIQSIFVGVK